MALGSTKDRTLLITVKEKVVASTSYNISSTSQLLLLLSVVPVGQIHDPFLSSLFPIQVKHWVNPLE